MPHKGRKPAGGAKGPQGHGAKKTTSTTKPADKKTTATDEKKPESTSASTSGTAGGASAAASAGSSKALSSQDRTMKAGDPKAQATPKTEPPKSTPATEQPKSTTTSTSSSSTAARPSTGKGPTKQDAKADSGKQKADSTPKATTTSSSSSTAKPSKPSKERGPTKQDAKADSKVSSSVAGKAAGATVGAAAIGAAAVGAAAVGASASVSASTKLKDEAKEEKKLSVDKIAAAAPISSEKDDALDLLLDTLGGPESVPESPKFTGPEVTDTPATSEYIEELGKRESTIPPEYRHLLDGKGEKPTEPPLKPADESMGDDDLIAAMSMEFVSAPPQEKKPKLEEKKTAQSASTTLAASSQPSSTKKTAQSASTAPAASSQPSSTKKTAQSVSTAPAASSQPSSTALTDEALEELLSTLEPPPANDPGSPQFTGPEIMEGTITSSHLEELGKREGSIPPKYRHLLDGKDDHGKPIPPSADKPEPAMTDSEVLDRLSEDFELSDPVSPAPPPLAAGKPQVKPAKPDVLIPSSASSVRATAAPSADIDDALDALMGTLEGSEFSAPESPVYTGPEVTETTTSSYIEDLGKREGSIPPKYRHLLDGKEGEKPAPASPEEKPMTDSEMLDEFDKEFTCPQPPAAQQTPPAKPKDVDVKKKESETVVKSCSSSSKIQAAPAPPKAPTCKADPLDTLSGTLGVRQEDPKDKKPVTDKVKEKTGKDKKEKLGDDEETIPPDYRLKEVKDKDGKPLLPKPEEKYQPMSEDDLLDALSEGFVTSPSSGPCAPSQSLQKSSAKPVSEEVVSSKASSVQSGAPVTRGSSLLIPDDALDMLSDSLGTRHEDPDDKKPIVDIVKEITKEEHIDRLGDRDDTIPPEYRHLLDGKDNGKPAGPEEVTPKTPLSDDAAIDALSSGFACCDAGSIDKATSSSKDKKEESISSTPGSQTAGKTPDSSKPTTLSTSTKPVDPKS